MWNIRICWETPFYCHVNGANDDDCSTNHEIDSVVFPTFSVTKCIQMLFEMFSAREYAYYAVFLNKSRFFIKKTVHFWNPPILGHLLFYGVFSPIRLVCFPHSTRWDPGIIPGGARNSSRPSNRSASAARTRHQFREELILVKPWLKQYKPQEGAEEFLHM